MTISNFVDYPKRELNLEGSLLCLKQLHNFSLEQCRLKLKSSKEKQLRNQNLSDKSGEGYHEKDTIDEKLDALLSNKPDENPVHVLQSQNCFVLPVQESMHELKCAARHFVKSENHAAKCGYIHRQLCSNCFWSADSPKIIQKTENGHTYQLCTHALRQSEKRSKNLPDHCTMTELTSSENALFGRMEHDLYPGINLDQHEIGNI
ncbi:unnamed protein product [Mytilus edulis]|uniref:Uncharacterized protein n=1 Tax=Mytilus edulis TaxID=6550 RepID=A0A8S3SSU6_MYTED|nr:unnamed protein product [Mytilus edulis]